MRVKQKRQLKQIAMLAGLCLIAGLILHHAMAPDLAYDESQFDIEKDLKLLPKNQRDAARAKWNSLSESQQNQVKRISQGLLEQQKKAIIEKVNAKDKSP